ncbi:MAG: hypothetical protein AAGA03_15230 [Planctomycetota bacterium]
MDATAELFETDAQSPVVSESQSESVAGVGAVSPSQPDEQTRLSKSERIRRYMADHPEVRNRDVAAALEPYGVTAADVANVKSHQKRKQKQPRGKVGRPKKGVAKPRSAESSPGETSTGDTLGLDVLDACVQLIEKAGGVDEAAHVLDLVRRIRSM